MKLVSASQVTDSKSSIAEMCMLCPRPHRAKLTVDSSVLRESHVATALMFVIPTVPSGFYLHSFSKTTVTNTNVFFRWIYLMSTFQFSANFRFSDMSRLIQSCPSWNSFLQGPHTQDYLSPSSALLFFSLRNDLAVLASNPVFWFFSLLPKHRV